MIPRSWLEENLVGSERSPDHPCTYIFTIHPVCEVQMYVCVACACIVCLTNRKFWGKVKKRKQSRPLATTLRILCFSYSSMFMSIYTAENESLQELSLRWNHLRLDGALAIAWSLKVSCFRPWYIFLNLVINIFLDILWYYFEFGCLLTIPPGALLRGFSE